MGALFVNKETIKQVVLLYRPAIGWTTKYINILCLLIRITLSSSLGWTIEYIDILCILIYITLSSSLGWTIGANNIMELFKLF